MKEKIKLFAESRRDMAKKVLDEFGYFGDWDRIEDLVGDDVVLAYKLGIHDSMYHLMDALVRVIETEIEEEDRMRIILGLENEDGTEQTFYVIAENLSEEKGLKILDDIHNVLVDIEALCSDVMK